MLGVRFLICVLFSVLLMVFAHVKTPFFQSLRATIGLAALPFQYVVNAPVKAVSWLTDRVYTERNLLAENARLRATNFLLQARLQRFSALEKENLELRGLLQSSSHVGGKVIIAQLLAVDVAAGLQQMILNKGTRQNIYVGQPVLDAYGVMGQVVDAGLLTSKVLLLTDTKSAIPVQSYRNGVRSVATGQGTLNRLVLLNVPETTDIREGDLFVSSGLGQRYPVGYPVGVVIAKTPIAGEHRDKIVLRPLAHLDRAQQVLLVWPNNADLAKVVQQQLHKPL